MIISLIEAQTSSLAECLIYYVMGAGAGVWGTLAFLALRDALNDDNNDEILDNDEEIKN